MESPPYKLQTEHLGYNFRPPSVETDLSEMPWEIHRVMQDSEDLYTFSTSAIKDNVPAFVVTVREANDFIAFSPHVRIICKIGDSIFKLFNVLVALLTSPFFVRVTANVFQVVTRLGGNRGFLHDLLV